MARRNLKDSSSQVAFWVHDIASTEEWKHSTAKGGALICCLEGSDQTAGRQMGDTRNPPSATSRFNGNLTTELQNWYWRARSPKTYSCNFDQYWKFSGAMQSLGLSGLSKMEGGDNEGCRMEHWDPSSVLKDPNNRDGDGNQIPAIMQWYTVPGNPRQYQVDNHLFRSNQPLLTTDNM